MIGSRVVRFVGGPLDGEFRQMELPLPRQYDIKHLPAPPATRGLVESRTVRYRRDAAGLYYRYQALPNDGWGASDGQTDAP